MCFPGGEGLSLLTVASQCTPSDRRHRGSRVAHAAEYPDTASGTHGVAGRDNHGTAFSHIVRCFYHRVRPLHEHCTRIMSPLSSVRGDHGTITPRESLEVVCCTRVCFSSSCTVRFYLCQFDWLLVCSNELDPVLRGRKTCNRTLTLNSQVYCAAKVCLTYT